MDPIRATCRVKNTASGRGTLAEHGLAFWIDTGTHRVLCDTGQTPGVLFHNPGRLKTDPLSADAVVLSLVHYDHTGGLAVLLKRANRSKLHLHPAVLRRRLSRQNFLILPKGLWCCSVVCTPA